MKKILLLFVGAIMLCTASFAQPVQDNVVIPIGITVNSIMRLNVKQGGNIEFVFNTIDQFENGIFNTNQYTSILHLTTTIDVNLNLVADAATFKGIATGEDLTLATVRYDIPTFDDARFTTTLVGKTPLANTDLIIGSATNGATATVLNGDITIKWECGTDGTVANSIVGKKADRYTVNVVISAIPQP